MSRSTDAHTRVAGPYVMLFDPASKGAWEHEVFVAVADYAQSRGVSLSIKETDGFAVRLFGIRRRRMPLSHTIAVFQNIRSGRFSLLDTHDWVTPFNVDIRAFATDPRCRLVLKCQYRREPYRWYPLTKIRPWTYFESHAQRFQQRVEALRTTRRTERRLFFRGTIRWENRDAILAGLVPSGIIHDEYGSTTSYDEYLDELAHHRVALALPGMGHLCHREIEAFGAGVPVIMPRLKVALQDDLRPDYHYISVEVDTLRNDPRDVARRIEARYREVEDDDDHLQMIASRAQRWYDDNVRFPSSLDLTARLLGLPVA